MWLWMLDVIQLNTKIDTNICIRSPDMTELYRSMLKVVKNRQKNVRILKQVKKRKKNKTKRGLFSLSRQIASVLWLHLTIEFCRLKRITVQICRKQHALVDVRLWQGLSNVECDTMMQPWSTRNCKVSGGPRTSASVPEHTQCQCPNLASCSKFVIWYPTGKNRVFTLVRKTTTLAHKIERSSLFFSSLPLKKK